MKDNAPGCIAKKGDFSYGKPAPHSHPGSCRARRLRFRPRRCHRPPLASLHTSKGDSAIECFLLKQRGTGAKTNSARSAQAGSVFTILLAGIAMAGALSLIMYQ